MTIKLRSLKQKQKLSETWEREKKLPVHQRKLAMWRDWLFLNAIPARVMMTLDWLCNYSRWWCTTSQWVEQSNIHTITLDHQNDVGWGMTQAYNQGEVNRSWLRQRETIKTTRLVGLTKLREEVERERVMLYHHHTHTMMLQCVNFHIYKLLCQVCTVQTSCSIIRMDRCLWKPEGSVCGRVMCIPCKKKQVSVWVYLQNQRSMSVDQ